MRLEWTVDDVMDLGPCWNRKDVESVFAGRERVSALDLLLNESIKTSDRFWFGVCGVLRDDSLRQRLLACDYAERALKREREAGREPDERSWKVIEVSRRYAWGLATVEELDNARKASSAASEAARAAAWEAARAARAAAWEAWEAASAAAWAAAWEAWEAARAARAAAEGAWDAERQWQLARLIEVVKDPDNAYPKPEASNAD
jgi:hypothetical protein